LHKYLIRQVIFLYIICIIYLQQLLHLLAGKPEMLASIYFHVKFIAPSLICWGGIAQ